MRRRVGGGADFRYPEGETLPGRDVRFLRGAQFGDGVGRFARLPIEGTRGCTARRDLLFGAENEEGGDADRDPGHRSKCRSRCA